MMESVVRFPPDNFMTLLFELKDAITLSAMERIMKSMYPGSYRFVRWADPDEVILGRAFWVVVGFSTEEDRIEFVLRWG